MPASCTWLIGIAAKVCPVLEHQHAKQVKQANLALLPPSCKECYDGTMIAASLMSQPLHWANAVLLRHAYAAGSTVDAEYKPHSRCCM
jgi:hypothetical protein